MIRVKVEVEGAAFLEEEILAHFAAHAPGAVNQAAARLADEMRELLGREGPPLPGMPPARIKGDVQRSIGTKGARMRGKYRCEAEAGSDHEAAAALEFGKTDDKGRVSGPHPYQRVAVTTAEDDIRAILGNAL